jgi:excisionase family DNA binding protein
MTDDIRPLGVREAAEFLGFSKTYLYKLIFLKKIPFYKPTGGRVFFKRGDLEKFIFRKKTSADYEIADQADAVLNGGRRG